MKIARTLLHDGRSIWAFRSFIRSSIRRELHIQVQGSWLGTGWLLLQALAMILLYTLVFSRVMGTRLPHVSDTYGYSIYLCSGLLVWNFFADALQRLTQVFVHHAHLIKKSNVPLLALPLIPLGVSLVILSLSYGLFLLFLWLSGHWPGWSALLAVPALVVVVALVSGLGLLAACLQVFFRDVAQMVPMSLMFWFWLTPIVYPASALPTWVLPWVQWNPMLHLLAVFQHALSGQPVWTAWPMLLATSAFSLALLVCAWLLFHRVAHDMADAL